MPLDANDPHVQDAVFGRQVELFLEQHDVGRYLAERATKDIELAMKELRDVDPTDAKAVMKAQFRLKVAESVVGWLADAINKGQIAQELVEGE